jgi:hypothetical protein
MLMPDGQGRHLLATALVGAGRMQESARRTRACAYFEDRRFLSPCRHGAAYGGCSQPHRGTHMKSIILWLLGVPIGVIILLKLFGVY